MSKEAKSFFCIHLCIFCDCNAAGLLDYKSKGKQHKINPGKGMEYWWEMQTSYPGLTDNFYLHEEFEYNGEKFGFFRANP